jgi:nicotinate-nucleotide adenylyltransferase
MVLGVFGGSFDPPHVGHVLAVSYVLSVHEVDALLVVPVYRHPLHKELAAFDDRLAMTTLAVAGIAGITVSPIERELGGESLTLRTLTALQGRLAGQQLRLVVGADVLWERDQWHHFDRVVALAPPIVLGRAGVAHPEAPPALLPEVSSRHIRDALREGRREEVAPLLPRRVREYIEARGLYR